MSHKPLILIAEDDLEDQFIMGQTFAELGYKDVIRFAEDGSMLLDLLLQINHEDVRLIILDLNMPRLNGTETLRIIKNHPDYKDIPVIIYSTSINEIEKSNCMRLGARDYLTKPSQYKEYLETCKQFYMLATG